MLDDIVAQSVSKVTGNGGYGYDFRRRRQIDETSGDEDD